MSVFVGLCKSRADVNPLPLQKFCLIVDVPNYFLLISLKARAAYERNISVFCLFCDLFFVIKTNILE